MPGAITGCFRSTSRPKQWKVRLFCLACWGLSINPTRLLWMTSASRWLCCSSGRWWPCRIDACSAAFFARSKDLRPQVDMFQRLRAVGRYDIKASLLEEALPPGSDMAEWVRDALAHYWGGPKLTQNPLLNLADRPAGIYRAQ